MPCGAIARATPPVPSGRLDSTELARSVVRGLDLAPQDQHLRLELCLVALARGNDFQEQTQE